MQDNGVQIRLKNSLDINVTRNDCAHNIGAHADYGAISIYGCSSGMLWNNTCTDSWGGIFLQTTDDVGIWNNTCHSNWNAIFVEVYSDRNVVSNNTVYGNSRGITIWYANNNTIVNNIVDTTAGYSGSFDNSIYLTHSNGTIIESNQILQTIEDAVLLENSHNTTLNDNTIEADLTAVKLDNCSYTTLNRTKIISPTLEYGMHIIRSPYTYCYNNSVQNATYHGIGYGHQNVYHRLKMECGFLLDGQTNTDHDGVSSCRSPD